VLVKLPPWRPALLALGILVAAPGVAQAATTYCVHQPADPCAAGTVDKGADLQAAITAADQTNDNTVSVGRGSYSSVGGFNAGGPGHGIQIVGAGTGATYLTAGTGVVAVITLNEPVAGARLSGVSIVATGTSQGGVRGTRADIDHISVVLPASSTHYAGVTLIGGSLTDSEIVSAPPFGNEGIGVETAGTALLERDTIRAENGVRASSGDLTAHDMTLVYGFIGLEADGDGTAATFDNGLLLIDPAVAPTNNYGLIADGGGDVTARSSTLVGTNPAIGTGMAVNAGAGHTSSGTLQSSIVKGIPQAVVRYTGGVANLTLGNDDMTVPPDLGGAGTYTPNSNSNVDVDPRFVDAASGHYELNWDSPLIDAGGTCGTPCQTVPDLGGLMRPIDGNGDGTAVRDIGAYEYGHRAPAITAAAATPVTVSPNDPVTFSATGADPDVGDPLAYTWTFDDGVSATGTSVVHRFATLGPHSATVTVSDPWNLVSPAAAATVTVTNPPPPPPVTDTTPPVLSRLALSFRTFAVGAKATKTSARATAARTKKKKKPPPRGTSIAFRLSEAATVVLTAEHRHTSSSCVARNRKRHRSTKSCTTYTRVGTITRKALTAGTASIAFSGRIGTKRLDAGAYRLRAAATDLAGNHAKTSPEVTFTIV
jgi:PKD repeat protein